MCVVCALCVRKLTAVVRCRVMLLLHVPLHKLIAFLFAQLTGVNKRLVYHRYGPSYTHLRARKCGRRSKSGQSLPRARSTPQQSHSPPLPLLPPPLPLPVPTRQPVLMPLHKLLLTRLPTRLLPPRRRPVRMPARSARRARRSSAREMPRAFKQNVRVTALKVTINMTCVV